MNVFLPYFAFGYWAMLLGILSVLLFGLVAILRNVSNKRDMADLEIYRRNHQLVTPELNAAIDLMYKGKIKEARTVLCRLRNSIQQPKDQ